MIKNYLKIAFRNLINQKLYSIVNITGLATGLAVCMMIMLYVAHETSYDKFHVNATRIYALSEHLVMGGQEVNMEYTSYASGPIIKQSEPEVADFTRTKRVYKDAVIENPDVKDVKYAESKMLFADGNFFRFFSFKLLSGQAAQVLVKPFSLVISQAMAKKYFGNHNPVGKTLIIKTDSAYTYQITGVAANVPSNSSIEFNFLASNTSLKAMKEAAPILTSQLVQGGAFTTYLLLKQPQDSMKVQHSIQSFIKGGSNGVKDKLQLTALPDMHLNSGDGANTKYLKIFILVAGLILLLAMVNYMSLSTARATLRAKEVGVRKISGATRKELAIQFYTESALVACLSFMLGYALCYTLRPWFLNTIQLKIDGAFLYSGNVLLILSGLLVLTVLLAGSYPSLVLSAFKPVITLKGKMGKQAKGETVRKAFTVFQFSIAMGLIVCGTIIYNQLYYFRHTDTGVNRENVLMVPISGGFGKQYQSFKNDVKSLSGISSVATSHYPMYKGYDMFFIPGENKEQIVMPVLSVDKSFIPTLNIRWKIAPPPMSDLSGGKKVIINEAAVAKLNLPANATGSFVSFGGPQKYLVAGVVKNFNFSSLQSAVQPLCMFVAADTSKDWGTVGGCLFAKITAHTNLPSLIEAVQGIYKKYDREEPFSYVFMDDAFNEQYKAEDRLAAIFGLFTGITILLAALGLFGLAAFTIQQRTKEVGIRKVLGANLTTIATLLSKDFLRLVLLAILIASPIAWWAMHNWLQNFAYRITISWWVFALAGGMAVVIAVVTISFQAIKAALANPVESLRSE